MFKAENDTEEIKDGVSSEIVVDYKNTGFTTMGQISSIPDEFTCTENDRYNTLDREEDEFVSQVSQGNKFNEA